jgi:hypothetical protein
MRNLVTHPVEVCDLHSILSSLPMHGRLSETAEGLVYLDVDDGFIHNTFPLLQHTRAQKPPYFDFEHGGVGAHISVFYPEERNTLHSEDWGKRFEFKIQKLVCVEFSDTKYFALLVNAPSLVTLRLKYGFEKKLTFKDYLIDFHITVASQILF